MTSMTFTGTLTERISRTPDATSYRFTRPPEYSFRAGQSYSITIPSPEGPLEHRFSHADSPTEPFTELTTRLTGSPFKNALDSLPLGAEATFRVVSSRVFTTGPDSRSRAAPNPRTTRCQPTALDPRSPSSPRWTRHGQQTSYNTEHTETRGTQRKPVWILSVSSVPLCALC